VSTDDGGLSESWALSALTDTADELSFSQELTDLSGSLVLEDFAPEGDWQSVRGWLDMTVGATSSFGTISGQVETMDRDTASAQAFNVAVIGEPSR
jgi:hypothetical protein